MKHVMKVVLVMIIVSGCATAPTNESVRAAKVMLKTLVQVSDSHMRRRDFRIMVEEYAREMDKQLTRDEIEDINRIYTDDRVRELMEKIEKGGEDVQYSFVSSALNTRVKELSITKALEKIHTKEFMHAVDSRIKMRINGS